MIYVKFRRSNIGNYLKYEKIRRKIYSFNGTLGRSGRSREEEVRRQEREERRKEKSGDRRKEKTEGRSQETEVGETEGGRIQKAEGRRQSLEIIS